MTITLIRSIYHRFLGSFSISLMSSKFLLEIFPPLLSSRLSQVSFVYQCLSHICKLIEIHGSCCCSDHLRWSDSGITDFEEADDKVQLTWCRRGGHTQGREGGGLVAATCGLARLSRLLPHPQQRSGAGWRGGLPLERRQVA